MNLIEVPVYENKIKIVSIPAVKIVNNSLNIRSSKVAQPTIRERTILRDWKKI